MALFRSQEFEVRLGNNVDGLDAVVLFEELDDVIDFFLPRYHECQRYLLDQGVLHFYLLEHRGEPLEVVAHVENDLLLAVRYPFEPARLLRVDDVVEDMRVEQHLFVVAHYLEDLPHNLIVYEEVRWLVGYLNERGIEIAGPFQKGADVPASRSDDARNASLYHARFLSGNVIKGVAEDVHVVVAQSGDGGAHGLVHYVCGIQVAADSTLKHSVLATLPFEFQKCDHGNYFKESEIDLFLIDCSENVLTVLDDVLLAGQDLVDGHPLPEGVDMRRGVQASLESQSLKPSCHLQTDRAFSIGTCHMNDLHLLLRIAKVLGKPPHLYEAGIHVLPFNKPRLTTLRISSIDTPSENSADVVFVFFRYCWRICSI